MAYATVIDVTAEFKNIDFTAATSSVTVVEVEGFLAQASSLIDASLTSRYNVPISPSYVQAMALLRMIEVYLVSSRISKIIDVKSIHVPSKGEIKHNLTYKDNEERAYALLANLSSGKLVLPGVPPLTSIGTSDYNRAHGVTPVFYKDKKQW